MSPRVRASLGWAAAAALSVGAAGLWLRVVERVPSVEWTRGGATFSLGEPRLLGVLAVVPLLAFALVRSLADLPWQQRVLSLLARAAFLGLLGLAVARPARTEQTDRVCTVLLVDVSDSVADDSLEDARAAVKAALAARPKDDLVKVVTFARRTRLVDLGEPAVVPSASVHFRLPDVP